MKKYRNHIDLVPEVVGKERRLDMLLDIMSGNTFLPKTVVYKDIDEAFESWVKEKIHIVSNEAIEIPTMTLYSNQRFSEYTQSWAFTDDNKNLILNFKTITRENNPQQGTIHNRLWNIPGEHFFNIKRVRVMDDDGTESFLDYKMKMPTAVDLTYKVSIFCTKFALINSFNEIFNKLFNASMVYLWVNNHPMPMKIDGSTDSSTYQIDDRQFYGQTFTIKVMGYIITDDDYRVDEIPLTKKLNFGNTFENSRKASVDIDEDNTELSIFFPPSCKKVKFIIDCDFEIDNFEVENIKKIQESDIIKDKIQTYDKYLYKLYVNGTEMVGNKKILKKNDEIEIFITKKDKNKHSLLIFFTKK